MSSVLCIPSVLRTRAHALAISASLMLALLGVACVDGDPVGPEESGQVQDSGEAEQTGAFSITCHADISEGTLACDGGGGLQPSIPDDVDALIVGGQGTFIQLTPANARTEPHDPQTTWEHLFEVDVTVQNLLPQALGTPNLSNATGVFVFYESGPTNGVVLASASGLGNFTGENQPFYSYPCSLLTVETSSCWLAPDETSGARTWDFRIPFGVETFSFTVLVSADVPHPDGWVDITPPSATVALNGSTSFSGTAFDAFGTPSGSSIAWSLSDETLASVDGSGNVTASDENRRVMVIASGSEGEEGTAELYIYEDLVERDVLMISDDHLGELYYRFVVPTGASSISAALASGDGLGQERVASALVARSEGERMEEPTEGAFTSSRAPAPPSAALVSSSVSSMLAIGIDEGDDTVNDDFGGANLYVRHGSVPIPPSEWDCRPVSGNSREVCDIHDPAAGEWFVLVQGGSAYENVRFGADFQEETPNFSIELEFRGSISSADQALFQVGADRWEEVITGNVPPYSLFLTPCISSSEVEQRFRIAEDLIIRVRLAPIDGSGGVLGSAGPCVLGKRDDTFLPALGAMTIDEDDWEDFADDALVLILTHEIGHVLGVGTIWEDLELLEGAGTSDPLFTGSAAIQAYEDVEGPAETDVPVENVGGSGSRDAHWRESVFQTELMTSVFNNADDELSLVTVMSMQDLGYTVDPNAADAYTLPSSFVIPATQISFGNDILDVPRWTLSEEGRWITLKEFRDRGGPR